MARMSPPLRAMFSPSHPLHAETCHKPGRGSSDFPHSALRGAARLSFTARIGRALFYRARSASKKDGLAVPLLFFWDRALREHRGPTGPSHPLLADFFNTLLQGCWTIPLLTRHFKATKIASLPFLCLSHSGTANKRPWHGTIIQGNSCKNIESFE